MEKAFFTENPGFKLPGGGTADWRQGAYVSDNWKIVPSFTLTAGVRWSVDTDRANQDLPTPPCSVVDPSLQAPCTGSSPLLDQFQPGFGKKIHQPYANFGPQLGFAYSPGDHKTVIRAAFGIFYESDVFNNTTNARGNLIPKGLFNDESHTICGGSNSLTLPDGNCADQRWRRLHRNHLLRIPVTVRTALHPTCRIFIRPRPRRSGRPAMVASWVTPLTINGAYAAPYRTPYSEQWNGGVQRELFPGGIVSVDYVHNSTLKITQQIDVNHVGAARTLRATAAQNAMAATTASFGCAGGFSSAAIDCAIAAGALITDFASNGLDSGNTFLNSNPASYNGLTPDTGAAFPGVNPLLGQGLFLLPAGRSGYDALQVVFREQKSHPLPGFVSSNLQVSYSLSRIVSTANPAINNGNTGIGDQFFASPSYDYDNPTQYIGRNGLDHTHEISFGGSANHKITGPRSG